jgi:hypothetical protein
MPNSREYCKHYSEKFEEQNPVFPEIIVKHSYCNKSKFINETGTEDKRRMCIFRDDFSKCNIVDL